LIISFNLSYYFIEEQQKNKIDTNYGVCKLQNQNTKALTKNKVPARLTLKKKSLKNCFKKRSQTLSTRRMAREHRKMKTLGEFVGSEQIKHPTTRSECVNMPRPCMFVSCRHHLYLDVNEDTGSVKFNFPDKDVWELEETCALDVADRGGITLEEVGSIMNLTRERIRQLELSGLKKLKHYSSGEDNLETYAYWDPTFDEKSSCN